MKYLIFSSVTFLFVFPLLMWQMTLIVLGPLTVPLFISEHYDISYLWSFISWNITPFISAVVIDFLEKTTGYTY